MIDNTYLFYTDYIHMYQLRFRLSDNSLSRLLPSLSEACMVNNIPPPLNDDVTRSQFPLKKSTLPGNSVASNYSLVLVKGHMNTVTKCCTEAVELAVYTHCIGIGVHNSCLSPSTFTHTHTHPYPPTHTHTHTQWGSTGICHCPTMGLLLELHKTKMGLELRLEESKTDIASVGKWIDWEISRRELGKQHSSH